MARSTIRQWFQRWFPSRLRRRPSPRPLRGRPVLEPLEDRWLPSTINWGNDTPGDWDNSVDWAGGVVPTAADDAVIPFNNITVTHSTNAADAVHSVNSAASFSLSAGSLAISSTGQFTNAFTLTGASSATLAGSGTVTLSGPTTWSGGTMNGTGLTILQGTTSYTGGTLDTRTLNNFGTVTQPDASLQFSGGGTVNNESGATWNMMNSSTFGAGVDFLIGTGSFNNLGTLTTSSASGSIDFSLSSFTNSDTITIQSGTLEVFPQPGGPTTLTNGSVINGGGNFQLANSATLTVLGNSTIGCGLFTLGNNTGSGFITLTGSGTATVSAQFDWVAGAMSGTGTTILQGSSTITGTPILDTRTLDNAGTVTQVDSTITFNNGAVVNNESGASWDLSSSSTVGTPVALLIGTGSFNNLGTLNSSSLNSALAINIAFNNSGTANVQSGDLNLHGGGTSTGTFAIASGATLDLFGAPYTFNTGTVVSGAGTLDIDTGTLNVLGNCTINSATVDVDAGTLNVTGSCLVSSNTLDLDAGTMTVGGGATINSANFDLNAGLLTVNGSVLINSTTVEMDAGTLNGSGIATFGPTTQLLWDSGTMSGSGVTNLDGSSTISGGNLDTRTLNNFGAVSDSADPFPLSNAAVINNESGATWNLQGSASINGGGTFNNLGTLVDSSTTTVTINLPFNNLGTVQVQNGALTVLGDGIESGTITVSGGTSMTFSAGSDTFTNGAVVNGAGTLVVNGNETVTATGAVTFGSANFTFDSSTLTGSGSVTVTSATTWSSGTMSGTGETDLLGSTTISPNGVALDTRTLKNFGTVEDNENLALSNAAVIDNVAGATWLLVATNATVFSGTGTFNNAGMFNMSGAGTDSIAVPFNNSGTVHVTSGGLTVLGDGTESGTINIDSSTTMTFSAGSDTFTNGALVQGAGTFVVNGNETVTVTGNVNFGSANFTFDSSTLTGSGTVTVNSATTWNNATMSGTGVTNLQGATTISGNNPLDTRTLNNFGTVTQNTSTLILLNGAVINNDEATWNLASTTDGLQLISGNGTFNNNEGTLSAASAVTIVLAVPVNNSGDINVQSGTLTLLSGGQSTGGTFVITGGATLDFGGGTYNIDITSFVQGAGNVTFSASTVTVAGAFTPTGAISILNAATANFTNTVDDTGSVTFTTLNLTFAGTLTGSATVTVTGATTWNNGTMSGSGVTNLLGNTTIGSGTLSGRTLNNAATVTVLGGLLDFGAVINNQSGAVWDLQNNASFGGQNDTFNNAGTLQMSSGTSSDFDATLNSSGLVQVLGGELDLLGGGTETGTFLAQGGTTLGFTGGTYDLNAGSAVTGAGSLAISFGSVANIRGGFTLTGPVSIGNGNSTLGTTANFTNTVNGTGSATISVLNLNGATLTGSGTVTVTGATSWSSGTMSGSGVTNFQGGLSLGGNDTVDARTLNNFGAATDSANLVLVNGAVINNQSGATWNLQGFTSTSSGVFNNLGTLQSTGSNSFTVTLNNSGTFNVQSGTLTGNSVVNNSGTVTLVGGGTLSVTSFTQTAGKLSGGGVLQVVNGVVINGGIVSPGSSPGILDIQGNYTQNGNSALNIEIDGTTAVSQYSVLAVSGTATLDGTLNIERTTGFVATSGQTFQILTASAVSGTFATVNGLQINGSESFTVTYNATNVVLGVGTQQSLPPDQLGIVTPAADGTATWTLYNDFIGTSAVTTFTFGLATDIPLVGDWNGSGFDSVGVVRPTAGGVAQWSLDTNGDHAFDAGDSVYSFGLITDIPVVGDWNGSGTTKIGTVRALPDGAAQWSLDSNGNGTFDNSDEVTVYGLATDRFGAGHWTGAGKDELAVVRPGAGGTSEWILNTTGTGVYTTSDTIYTFGLATDSLVVGDWNGDGRTKIGVERPGPNGTAVFTLDTNGDGVYDAGDQVIIIPATAAGSFEFGNWKRLAGLTVTNPPNALVPPLPLDATFQADVNLAINEWAQAGLNGADLAQLRGLTYSVSTLGGGTTALTDGNHIVLDATAAGNGWLEGPTPQPGQIDLVTTLAHEMGHALGLGHSPDPNDVMFATLPTGVRRAPTAADVNALGMQ